MEIIELTPAQRESYFVCLEEWSEEMKESAVLRQHQEGHRASRALPRLPVITRDVQRS